MKEKEKIAPFILRLGIMIGVAYIAAVYLFYFSGREILFNSGLSTALNFLTIFGVYVVIQKCRKLKDHKTAFGEMFLSGVAVIAIAAFIKSIANYILYTIINPVLGEEYVKIWLKSLKEGLSSMNSQKQTDLFMRLYEMLITPLSLSIAEIFGHIFLATLFSLMLAGLTAIQNK